MRGQNAGVGGMIMTNSNMSSMQNVGMTSGSKYYFSLIHTIHTFDKCSQAEIITFLLF